MSRKKEKTSTPDSRNSELSKLGTLLEKSLHCRSQNSMDETYLSMNFNCRQITGNGPGDTHKKVTSVASATRVVEPFLLDSRIGANGGHLVPPRDIKISDISMKEAFQRMNFWLGQVVSWIACDSNRYRAMIRLSSECALFIVTVTTITLFQVRHRDWGINTLTGCTSR